jgi:hypothetical protein
VALEAVRHRDATLRDGLRGRVRRVVDQFLKDRAGLGVLAVNVQPLRLPQAVAARRPVATLLRNQR